MAMEFLRNYGGSRIRSDVSQPTLLGESGALAEPGDDENIDLDYEASRDKWRAVTSAHCPDKTTEDFAFRPRRFVDGKDVGQTVAWLRSPDGFPVPVRLAEVGATSMRDCDGALRREWSRVERVVSLLTDPFPWDEVENFAWQLRENGFRLLPVSLPPEGLSFDFQTMRELTQRRSHSEMESLEREAMLGDLLTPTLLDGRLDRDAGAYDPLTAPLIGFVKSHYVNYFGSSAPCWNTYYDLEPGQRTPAFSLEVRNTRAVTWYLRLCGANGEMPNWGVVRLEIAQPFFENTLGGNFTEIDRISRLMCRYRCRDESYGRAPVSIQPIVRAEESLGALFTNADTLISRFYRLTGL